MVNKKISSNFVSLGIRMIKIKPASTIMVTGVSKSGKSWWVFRLLKNKDIMFEKPVHKVFYHYSVYQSLFDQMKKEIPNIFFIEGVPESLEPLSEKGLHNLVIFDDLMFQMSNDAKAGSFFTIASHHYELSIIYLTQNMFAPGKISRTISLNSEYLCIFKNLRDSHQVSHLGSQIFPGQSKSFLACYKDAVEPAYGYLFIDLTARSSDLIRLRTKIFPDERTIIYQLL